MQAQLVGDFRSIEGVWKILLVCKDKEEGVAQLVFVQHALELVTGFTDTFAIVGVYDEDDALCVLEI